MSIVSNTGPLIALAKVDQLGLLHQLFDQVYIPPAVHRELFARVSPEVARLEQALSAFIQVKPISEAATEVKAITRLLDPGEEEAVTLAYQLEQALLIDDRLGRQSANRLNIPVTGLVGMLILAQQKNLIPSLSQLLEKIRASGYWLSDELIANAIKLAGES